MWISGCIPCNSEKAVGQTFAQSRLGRLITFVVASLLARKSQLKASRASWLWSLFFFFRLSLTKILPKPVTKIKQNAVVDREKSILLKPLTSSPTLLRIDANLFSTDGSVLARTSEKLLSGFVFAKRMLINLWHSIACHLVCYCSYTCFTLWRIFIYMASKPAGPQSNLPTTPTDSVNNNLPGVALEFT